MSTSVLDWKQNIIHQLKLRNKREKEPFENLIQSCECVNSVFCICRSASQGTPPGNRKNIILWTFVSVSAM